MWVMGCVVVGFQHAPPAMRHSSKPSLREASFATRTLQPAMRLPATATPAAGAAPSPAGTIKPHRPRAKRAAPSRCADSRMEGTGKREEVNMCGSEVLLGYRSLPDLDLRPAHGNPPLVLGNKRRCKLRNEAVHIEIRGAVQIEVKRRCKLRSGTVLCPRLEPVPESRPCTSPSTVSLWESVAVTAASPPRACQSWTSPSTTSPWELVAVTMTRPQRAQEVGG